MNRHSYSTAGRRGVTLMEMIVVIAVMSVVLGTLTITLISVLRSERNHREEVSRFQNLSRLSRQLRIDAHSAREIGRESEDSKPLLRLLQEDGGAVTYQSDYETLTRTHQQGDHVTHRDSFALPKGTQLTWDIIENDGRTTISLRVSRSVNDPKNADEPGLPTLSRIDAVVGLSNPHMMSEPVDED